MGMGMRMAVIAIGAAFWLKWLLDAPRFPTKALDHCRKHMVMADQNTIRLYFRRSMSIAEVPREAHQRQPVARCHFQ
tara:strand:- start:33 stop:263 length:231 start_codon:yes stop_codon:yes gene_type:complete